MQERRRLLRRGYLGFQLFAFRRIRVQLVLHDRRRHAFHHHLDQLLAPGLHLGGQLKTGNLWTAQNRQFAGGRDQ
jgi:hypothetical protein